MQRGLRPRAGTGRAAVLALDLITDFEFPDGAALRRHLAARAGAIQRLLESARRRKVPVIYANDSPGAWRSDSASLIARASDERRPGAKLLKPLMPSADDLIVLKPRHSAFFGTPLSALLHELDVDTVVLAGVSAESCVWMTACAAYTRGFKLVVPRDAIAGVSMRGVQATLRSLREVLGARAPARASGIEFAAGRIR